MFRSPLHFSTFAKDPSLARKRTHLDFSPIGAKESYEKNTSTLFTLFDFIVS
jgi:hypothetical protein